MFTKNSKRNSHNRKRRKEKKRERRGEKKMRRMTGSVALRVYGTVVDDVRPIDQRIRSWHEHLINEYQCTAGHCLH